MYQIGNFPKQPEYQYVVDPQPPNTQYIAAPIQTQYIQHAPVQTQYILADQPQPQPVQYVYADNYYKPKPRTNYVYLDDSDTEEVVEEVMVTPKPRNKIIYVDDDQEEILYSPRQSRMKPTQYVYQDSNDIYGNSRLTNKNMIKYQYSDYEEEPLNRNRVYRPAQTQRGPVARSQSTNYEPQIGTRKKSMDWIDKWSPKRNTVFSSRNPLQAQYTLPKTKNKKPNHRREIDEPTIRDWPTPNKNVIHGGAVVYK